MTHFLLDGLLICGDVDAGASGVTTELLAVTCPACVDVLTHVGALPRSVAALPRDDRALPSGSPDGQG
jgi:hypothetical protein